MRQKPGHEACAAAIHRTSLDLRQQVEENRAQLFVFATNDDSPTKRQRLN